MNDKIQTQPHQGDLDEAEKNKWAIELDGLRIRSEISKTTKIRTITLLILIVGFLLILAISL